MFAEAAVLLHCDGGQLVGVLSKPVDPSRVGVVVVVGGPQYRVGAHRQFVLLARRLASAGYAVLRFDYRGMGDSDGEMRNFDTIESDINTAVSALLSSCPEVCRVVLWGLCDGASAALMFAGEATDKRVAGLCLLNPWVRSDATLARTQLKHYYGERLLQSEFWRKVMRGDFDWRGALRGVQRSLRLVVGRGEVPNAGRPFQARMASALRTFSGPVLLMLSTNDYTAKEFVECAKTDKDWHGHLDRGNLQRVDIAGADHTLSRPQWRTVAEHSVLNWLAELKESG